MKYSLKGERQSSTAKTALVTALLMKVAADALAAVLLLDSPHAARVLHYLNITEYFVGCLVIAGCAPLLFLAAVRGSVHRAGYLALATGANALLFFAYCSWCARQWGVFGADPWIVIGFWLWALLCASLAIVCWVRRAKAHAVRNKRDAIPVCKSCGYDLRGSVEQGRCPECGTPADARLPRRLA